MTVWENPAVLDHDGADNETASQKINVPPPGGARGNRYEGGDT